MGQRAADLATAALSGGGGTILLTGEAGIGKTHLARALYESARTDGATVAWARAGRAGAPPFRPWIDVLRHLGCGDVLGEVSPEATADLRSRFELFDSVSEALRERSRHDPLLIVLDDLHLADSASLLLMAHLAPHLVGARIALVATVRDDLASARPEWDAVWGDVLRSSSVVAVQPLSRDAIAAMVVEQRGAPASDAELARILDRTGGNALFVRELLSFGGAEDRAAVPPSVRAVVAARVAGRSADCRRVLGLASVIGVVVPITLLIDVLGEPSGSTLDLLEEAAGEGLVVRVDGQHLRFSHEIVRDAVYDALPLAQRTRWHASVATALAGRAAPVPAEVAEHFSDAGPDHTADAASWWERAGESAMATMAYEEAARCFARAIDTAGLSGRLHVRLGDSKLAYGDAPGAREAYLSAAAIARRAGDAHVLASAALGLGSGAAGFEVSLLDREQIDALTDASRMLPDADKALRARVLGRLSVALTFSSSIDRRAELTEEALRLASECGDDGAMAVALASQCDVIGGPAFAAERLAVTSRIVEIAERLHDSTLELLGRRMRIVARLELGDIAGFTDDVRTFATIARALRQPLYLWYVPLWQALSALYGGEFDECAALIDEASALADAAGSVNAPMLLPTLRWCLANESGPDALRAFFGREPLEGVDAPWVPFTKALMQAQLGNVDESRRLLDAAWAQRDNLPPDGNWLATVAQTAEALGVVGAHPIAEWVHESLAPYEDLFVVEGIGAGLRGSVHRHLALAARALGRADEAADHFARAIAANEQLGLPVLVRRVHSDAGRPPNAPSQPPVPATAVFRRDGELWTLGFQGTAVSLRDSKGLRDLVRLLAEPERPFAAVDLAASDGRAEQSDLGDVIDAEARAAYKRRLEDLALEADEADASGDAFRAERIARERDALVEQLTSAYGLAGRSRTAGSTVERARTTVTARIRDAIKRIEAVHPALGRHLRASVRTGTVCVYSPPEPVRWQF